MLKFSHSTLIFFSGLLWLAIGLFLLPLGLHLLMSSLQALSFSEPASLSLPLLNPLSQLLGNANNATVCLIVTALIIGFFKGKYVLGKSVQRTVMRLRTFPNPTSIKNVYTIGYCILIAAMILLGVLIKFFHLVSDIRGVIDIAVGSALINGAMLYFRAAVMIYKNPTVTHL